jgi:hypothetical protein
MRINRAGFPSEWRAVLLRDPCVYCYGLASGLDHIQPRSRLGTDGWENRAPACSTCDGQKHSIQLLLFLAGQYGHVIIPTTALPLPKWRRRALREEQTVPPLRYSLSEKFAEVGFLAVAE